MWNIQQQCDNQNMHEAYHAIDRLPHVCKQRVSFHFTKTYTSTSLSSFDGLAGDLIYHSSGTNLHAKFGVACKEIDKRNWRNMHARLY